jgi:hypothetical protein
VGFFTNAVSDKTSSAMVPAPSPAVANDGFSRGFKSLLALFKTRSQSYVLRICNYDASVLVGYLERFFNVEENICFITY